MKQAKKIRKVSYRSSSRQGEPIPCLPIQGLFLNRYGFHVGDNVDVRYSEGFVHIKKIITDRYGDAAACCVVR